MQVQFYRESQRLTRRHWSICTPDVLSWDGHDVGPASRHLRELHGNVSRTDVEREYDARFFVANIRVIRKAGRSA